MAVCVVVARADPFGCGRNIGQPREGAVGQPECLRSGRVGDLLPDKLIRTNFIDKIKFIEPQFLYIHLHLECNSVPQLLMGRQPGWRVGGKYHWELPGWAA